MAHAFAATRAVSARLSTPRWPHRCAHRGVTVQKNKHSQLRAFHRLNRAPFTKSGGHVTVVCHSQFRVLAQLVSSAASGLGPHRPGLEQTKVTRLVPGPHDTSRPFLSAQGPYCTVQRPEERHFHTNKLKNNAVTTAKTTTALIHLVDIHFVGFFCEDNKKRMSYPADCKDRCGQQLTRAVRCVDRDRPDVEIPDEFCLAIAPKPDAVLRCPVCSVWDNVPVNGICEQKDPANPRCGPEPENWGRERQRWECRGGEGQCKPKPEPVEPPPDAICEIRCQDWRKTYSGTCRNEDASVLCDIGGGGQNFTWTCPAGLPALCKKPIPEPGWEANGCTIAAPCTGNWVLGPCQANGRTIRCGAGTQTRECDTPGFCDPRLRGEPFETCKPTESCEWHQSQWQ
jgi:hypothetical protein